MRNITINLWQNTGTLLAGAMQTISANLVDVAEVSQEVDGENAITKVTPGSLTCKVLDPDGSIWDFMQNYLRLQLVSGDMTANGMLPPWLEMYVGSVRVFLGTVDPSRIQNLRSATEWAIELEASDWSMLLSGVYLGVPTALPWRSNTTYPGGYYVTNGGRVYKCVVGGTSAGSGGPSGVISPITDGTVIWSYIPPTWLRPVPKVAAVGSAVEAAAWSVDYRTMALGQHLNQIYFPDPQSGFYAGAVLSMDRPVLHFVPRDKVGLPELVGGDRYQPPDPGDTFQDIDGQTWRVDLHDGNYSSLYWTQLTTWSTPIGCPSMVLPSAQFPAGMILANAAGTKWQVSADELTWHVGVYDASSDLTPKIIGDPVDQTTMAITAGPFQPPSYPFHVGPYLAVNLSSSPWPAPVGSAYSSSTLQGNWSANFTLAQPTVEDITYWVTTVDTTTEQNWLDLNGVEGMAVGDGLQLIGSGSSWSGIIAGVDPVLSRAYLVSAVGQVIPKASHIYWTTSSQEELVYEDPRSILKRAVAPYDVNLDHFAQPVTADPMFGFLSMTPYVGDGLQPIGDIEPAPGGGIRLSTGAQWTDPSTGLPMAGSSWTGDPDGGWTGPSSSTQPMADWTRQLVAQPSSLMPYEVVARNPFQRLRNRPYSNVIYRQEDNGIITVEISGTAYHVNGAYVGRSTTGGVTTYTYTQAGNTYTTGGANFTPWAASWAPWAGQITVYDYLQMRRLTFLGAAVTVHPWTGTAWGTSTSATWPGTSWYVQDAAPMIGHAGSVLAYVVDATTAANPRLELWGLSGGLTAYRSVPSALLGGQLSVTPYGVFLVAASSIARVTYSGGVLSVDPVMSLIDQVDWLWAGTLVARTAEELVIFGRLDESSGGSTATSTWMFRLSVPFSSTLDASTIASEKIAEGAPPLIGAMRDPTRAGRIVGHYGGALWQVDAMQPYCIERFKGLGMKAMDLLEHVAQLMAAVLIPDANGVIHVVSRAASQTPIALTPDQVEINESISWPDFASVIQVSSSGGDYTATANGQQGGSKLEIDTHPLVTSESGADGMASALVPWFGRPRKDTKETWLWTPMETPAPWETVRMFSEITVNGGAEVLLMSRAVNYLTGRTKVRTLEAGGIAGTGAGSGGGGEITLPTGDKAYLLIDKIAVARERTAVYYLNETHTAIRLWNFETGSDEYWSGLPSSGGRFDSFDITDEYIYVYYMDFTSSTGGIPPETGTSLYIRSWRRKRDLSDVWSEYADFGWLTWWGPGWYQMGPVAYKVFVSDKIFFAGDVYWSHDAGDYRQSANLILPGETTPSYTPYFAGRGLYYASKDRDKIGGFIYNGTSQKFSSYISDNRTREDFLYNEARINFINSAIYNFWQDGTNLHADLATLTGTQGGFYYVYTEHIAAGYALSEDFPPVPFGNRSLVVLAADAASGANALWFDGTAFTEEILGTNIHSTFTTILHSTGLTFSRTGKLHSLADGSLLHSLVEG